MLITTKMLKRIASALGVLGLLFSSSLLQAADTIKIAYVEPMSGPLANVGDAGLKHFRYKAEQMNKEGGILGKDIEIVPFDNKGSPQESLIILRKIADQGISYVTQGNGSHVGSALISGVERHNRRNPNKIVYLNYAAVDPVLTKEECSFWHFRFDANTDMKLDAFTSFIADKKDAEKVYLINMDYAHGHQIADITKKLLPEKDDSIEIVGNAFHPIGKVKDFSPYISKIRSSGADSIITGNWGNDLSLLIRAAAKANLDVNFYTYYGGGLGSPAAIGKAGEGRVFQITEYHRNLPLEMDKEEEYDFILPFDEKNGKIDWYYGRISTELDMLKQAMEDADSVDPTDVAFALEGSSFETPYGEATMRKDDHQLLQPLFISKLTKDVEYDAEQTGLGFSTVSSIDAEETAPPVACEMTRPDK